MTCGGHQNQLGLTGSSRCALAKLKVGLCSCRCHGYLRDGQWQSDYQHLRLVSEKPADTPLPEVTE